MSFLLTFSLFFAIPAPPAAKTSACEFGRDKPIPEGSTFADQFRCYKTTGREVSIPGTTLADGGLNGRGCIVSVATDRVQLASCTGSSWTAVTIPFASIQLLVDESNKDFVTVVFR